MKIIKTYELISWDMRWQNTSSPVTILSNEKNTETANDWIELTKNNTLKDNDVLYVKYCPISLVKLQEKYPNITTTEDITNATKFVINNALLERIFDFKRYRGISPYKYSKNDIINQLNHINNKYKIANLKDDTKIVKLIKDITNINSPIIKGGRGLDNVLKHINLSYFDITKYKLSNDDPRPGTKKEISYYQILIDNKNIHKLPFVMDNTLYSDLTSIKMNVDEPIYESLFQMLSSKDEQSHKLAIEIMSNADIENDEASKLYCLILINQFRWKLKIRQNVNLNLLLNNLGLKNKKKFDIKELIPTYKDIPLLSDILKKKYIQELNKTYSYMPFIIKDIDFKN